MAKQPKKPKPKPMVKPTVSKIKKAKTVKPTWSKPPAKKPPAKKAAKDDGGKKKTIIRTKDGRWWSDLAGTTPANDPQWHEQNGWLIDSDQAVNNPAYPDVDRQVDLIPLLPQDEEIW